MATQYDLNLRDYWRILRKRKWAVGFVTVAFGAMAFTFAEVQKPQPIYQATAVVKYERSTTLVGLLVESMSFNPGDNMATQAAVVRSFTVLERAAKALRLIPAELDSEAVKQNARYIELLSDLRKQVAAAPEENTTLINITMTSRDPALAARVANAVAQAYQEENSLTRNRQIREARQFIEEQTAEVSGGLRQTENKIRALKEQRRFVSLAEETSASLSRLTLLEGELDKVRRVQQETAGQIQALQDPRAVAGTAPPRIFTDASDPTIAKLNITLLDLSLERDTLLATLTPRHPQIIDLTGRIATTRENLLRELRLKHQTFLRRVADLQRQIEEVRELLRTLPDVAQQYAELQREATVSESLLSQLRTKYQEVQIKEKELVNEVTLVRPAIEPAQPTNSAQVAGKGIIGLLIGLTVGLVLAFVLESMDTSIGTIEDVETYLEVPVLALVPNIDATKDVFLAPPDDEDPESPLGRMRPFLVTLLNPRSTVAEAYRSLRTNVEFLALEKRVRTLCLTSASLMEGKTTTAINLAVTIAQAGKKTLLVEADLRKPFLHHAFGIPRDPGLTEVIVGTKDWHECLRTATDLMLGPLGVDNIMAAPNIDKLSLLTSGTPPPNPTEFLNSQRMTDLIAAFRQEFDFVIFDCPPILPVTDAAILASRLDGALIVYRVGKIARSALKRSKTILENVRGKVLGMVLTGLKADVSPDFEDLQYYRYAYGHEPNRPAVQVPERMVRPSLFQRLIGFLPGGKSRKLFLLIPPALVLAGAGAWWAGALPLNGIQSPTAWVQGLRPTTARPIQEPHAGPVPVPPPPVVAGVPEPGPLETAAPVPAPTPAAAPSSPPADLAVPRPPVARPPAPPQAKPAAPPPAPAAAAAAPSPTEIFSIQVGSFHSRKRSLAYARTLREHGLQIFTVPVDLPGQGTWYRVMIGRYDSAASAVVVVRNLMANGTISEAEVQRLPYAVEVVGLATKKDEAQAERAARDLGYLPVFRAGGGDRPAGRGRILLVEAFDSPEQAERLAARLRAQGLTPRVIVR